MSSGRIETLLRRFGFRPFFQVYRAPRLQCSRQDVFKRLSKSIDVILIVVDARGKSQCVIVVLQLALDFGVDVCVLGDIFVSMSSSVQSRLWMLLFPFRQLQR